MPLEWKKRATEGEGGTEEYSICEWRTGIFVYWAGAKCFLVHSATTPSTTSSSMPNAREVVEIIVPISSGLHHFVASSIDWCIRLVAQLVDCIEIVLDEWCSFLLDGQLFSSGGMSSGFPTLVSFQYCFELRYFHTY